MQAARSCRLHLRLMPNPFITRRAFPENRPPDKPPLARPGALSNWRERAGWAATSRSPYTGSAAPEGRRFGYRFGLRACAEAQVEDR